MPTCGAGWRNGQRVALFFRVNRERQGGPKEATMKRFTNYVTTAAAVLIATAGVASEQSRLTAEAPFAFHVGNNVMDPATIQVRLANGNPANAPLVAHNFPAHRT